MRTKRQNIFLIWTLGVLNALTPLSIDMYLAAFPRIAHDLNTTIERVAFSISSYFIGFALGQIIYGPLLDRFGRKPPIYVGLLIYFVASIGCAMSQSIEMLMAFRFLQALGGCASSVAAIAMVRDFFPVEEGARVLSMLMLVLSVSPLLAPTFGGFVMELWGWRVIFAILALIAVFDMMLVYFFLRNAQSADLNVSLKLRSIVKNFVEILKIPQFSVYTFAGSFSFAGLFVFVAGSPAIFMDGFKVSTQAYGGIFAFLASGMIGGGQLNLLLTRRFSNQRIFKTTLALQVIFGAIFFIGTFHEVFGIVETIGLLFVVLLCAGIGYPNAAAIAMAPFSKNAGSASALLGFLQLSLGSITSAAVGMLNIKGSLPTAATISISATIGLLVMIVGQKSLKSL